MWRTAIILPTAKFLGNASSSQLTHRRDNNRSYKQDVEAAVKVEIPGGELRELDRKTGNWSDGPVLGTDREVTVKLGPDDGRLFRAGPGISEDG